jgi:hypothetical protein
VTSAAAPAAALAAAPLRNPRRPTEVLRVLAMILTVRPFCCCCARENLHVGNPVHICNGIRNNDNNFTREPVTLQAVERLRKSHARFFRETRFAGRRSCLPAGGWADIGSAAEI